MKSIPRESIIQIWEGLCALGQTASQSLVKRFMDEQPALGIYLYAGLEQVGQDSCTLELGIAIWKAFTEASGRRLNSITPEQIEAFEESNTSALEQLEEGSEMEFTGFAQNIIQSHNQRELIGFALEVLMSGNEENPELAPESIGLELLYLKTIVDVLDQHG